MTTAQMVGAMPTRNNRIMWALAMVYVIWGSTYLAIKFALISIPPYLQMGSRFMVAGGLLYAYSRMRGLPHPTWRQWRNALIIGSLMLVCGMGLLAYAQQFVSSGLTAVTIAVMPIVLAMMYGVMGQWPSKREWCGISLGVIGVLLLINGVGLGSHPQAVAALLLAICAWALGSVLSQHKFQLASGTIGYASEMLCGGAILLLMGMLRGEQMVWPLDPRAVFAWIYLIVAGSLVAFSAYMYLLANVRPSVASSYVYVNPVIAIILGAWLGGETLTGREWLATAIILLSVVLITARKAEK